LHFTYLNEAIFDLSNGQLKFDFVEHFEKPRVKSGGILKAKKENRQLFLRLLTGSSSLVIFFYFYFLDDFLLKKT